MANASFLQLGAPLDSPKTQNPQAHLSAMLAMANASFLQLGAPLDSPKTQNPQAHLSAMSAMANRSLATRRPTGQQAPTQNSPGCF
jgi:hypothetical protein